MLYVALKKNTAETIMSLRTLNRDPKYATGEYSKMFDIDILPSNADFVRNPYKPGDCSGTGLVCFSLTKGAKKCKAPKSTHPIPKRR